MPSPLSGVKHILGHRFSQESTPNVKMIKWACWNLWNFFLDLAGYELGIITSYTSRQIANWETAWEIAHFLYYRGAQLMQKHVFAHTCNLGKKKQTKKTKKHLHCIETHKSPTNWIARVLSLSQSKHLRLDLNFHVNAALCDCRSHTELKTPPDRISSSSALLSKSVW